MFLDSTGINVNTCYSKFKSIILAPPVQDGRLFAFPHSQRPQLLSCLCLPTKGNHRLCCDESSFQLFEGRRRNTWVHIRHGGSDDSSYRTVTNLGDRRRSTIGRTLTL
ncbi:hypothetical protein GGR55DRAFT_668477 [Xylaria sp. FL0064]|nr:hypothetical protein GGR55DRAFT_668477 [Xylaria sp. FL0064]